MGVSNTCPRFGGVNALTSANGLSFNGTRGSHNIYLLDGGELNDRGCGGCFSSLPSMDALAEFQTLASNYGPDYGIGSGGTITMVLKSGTNKFHGALWEFFRNEVFDANNYFTNLAGQRRPKFRLNEPGGNIGGPIWIPHLYNQNRDRTFFFVNEEWRRLIQGSSPSIVNTIAASNFAARRSEADLHRTGNGTVPIVPLTTDPLRLRLRRQRPHTRAALQHGRGHALLLCRACIIPANLIDQNTVLELNAGTFPKPNFGTSQYISSIPQPTNVREDVVRIDHKINGKLQLMGHYLHDQVTQTYFPPLWGNSSYPTVGTAMLNPSWSSTIKLTQTLSSSTSQRNGFPLQRKHHPTNPVGNSLSLPATCTTTVLSVLPTTSGNRLPEIQLGAPMARPGAQATSPGRTPTRAMRSATISPGTRACISSRSGSAGCTIRRTSSCRPTPRARLVFNSSSFSGDSYVNFLLGDTASFTQLNYLAGKHWVNNNYSFYVRRQLPRDPAANPEPWYSL